MIKRLTQWLAVGTHYRPHPNTMGAVNYHTPHTRDPRILVTAINEAYKQLQRTVEAATDATGSFGKAWTGPAIGRPTAAEADEATGHRTWNQVVDRALILGIPAEDIMKGVYGRCTACHGNAQIELVGEIVTCGRCGGTGLARVRPQSRRR